MRVKKSVCFKIKLYVVVCVCPHVTEVTAIRVRVSIRLHHRRARDCCLVWRGDFEHYSVCFGAARDDQHCCPVCFGVARDDQYCCPVCFGAARDDQHCCPVCCGGGWDVFVAVWVCVGVEWVARSGEVVLRGPT